MSQNVVVRIGGCLDGRSKGRRKGCTTEPPQNYHDDGV